MTLALDMIVVSSTFSLYMAFTCCLTSVCPLQAVANIKKDLLHKSPTEKKKRTKMLFSKKKASEKRKGIANVNTKDD